MRAILMAKGLNPHMHSWPIFYWIIFHYMKQWPSSFPRIPSSGPLGEERMGFQSLNRMLLSKEG
jgi:hypothetical protein